MAYDNRPRMTRTPRQVTFDKFTARTFLAVLLLALVVALWFGPTTAMARIAGAF